MERAKLIELLRATGCAEERNGLVLLHDPCWPERDRTAAERIWQDPASQAGAADGLGWLGIPTGGTSGVSRWARHDERTLGAAVAGFCAHFGLKQVNAVGVLPAHHVSGLMARVRCAATGGTHVAWDWKDLEAGRRPSLAGGDWVLSLVPTQLQRLMAAPEAVAWLRGCRVIFIGGAPIWPELTRQARDAGLRLSLSYGMTETAAMVTALTPEEFLAGGVSSGRPLPHARIALSAEGTAVVAGESVFRGYFPSRDDRREFATEDLARFDAQGGLEILGRRDAVIITGGEKVLPAEVEAVLRASGQFDDVVVAGVPDAEWGEAVVAFYPANGRALGMERVTAVLESLAAFKRPKRYVAVDRWPRTPQGKVNRAALAALAGELNRR